MRAVVFVATHGQMGLGEKGAPILHSAQGDTISARVECVQNGLIGVNGNQMFKPFAQRYMPPPF